MSDAKQRYPLAWPANWPRLKGWKKTANFGTRRAGEGKKRLTIDGATSRLMSELERLGVKDGDALLSTNLALRFDGRPRAGQGEPADPGVACYFELKKQDRVLACDTWTRVADNIAAIAAHVEAIRAIERYGVGSIEQAFAGYTGLPASGSTWRTTLGFTVGAQVTADQINEAYRERAREAHPDAQSGSHDAMTSLNMARDEGLRSIRGVGAQPAKAGL